MRVKGSQSVIDVLNEVLGNELVAINQYLLHSRMLKNWGLVRFADYEYHESIDEMRHADHLVERILFLDGLPNLQQLGKLYIGEHVREILDCDLKLEAHALKSLKRGIALCEAEQDFVSRLLLESILKSEEEHIDWIEAQFALIDRMGLENYVQLQSRPADAGD